MLSLLVDAPSSILAALNRRSDCNQDIHVSCGNYANSFTAAGAGWIGSRRGSSTNLMWQFTYVEYATSQDGDWEPLESLPRDKNVMIGVVTSRLLELECKEELMHRTSLSGESTDSALQSQSRSVFTDDGAALH